MPYDVIQYKLQRHVNGTLFYIIPNRSNKQATWPFFTFPFSLPDVADQRLYEQRKASLHLAFTICRDALYI